MDVKVSFSPRADLIRAVLAALTFGFALHAKATESLVDRKIVSMGCHETSGTCYVAIDGAPFGAVDGCPIGPTNEFRWDDAETANGRRAYASMLTAFTMQSPMSITVSGCSTQGWPKLAMFRIKM
jgi:hypothetical protein